MNLPNKENVIITHYGCSDFNLKMNIVFWIGAIYFENGQKKYLFLDGNEIDILEEYFSFLRNNKHKQILHWSMNTPLYSFKALSCRYKELTAEIIDINFIDDLDLSEYFKEKYSIDYIERTGGRLNNLAMLNSFSGFSDKVEVVSKIDAANRLELIFSIYQAEQQGCLKVNLTENTEGIIANKATNVVDTLKPQKNDLYKEEIFEMQNNLIPKMDISKAYNHFEVLAITTNKNNEFYLTHAQLLNFIKTTFVDKNPIKQHFNCKGFKKKKVRKIFYDFYFENKNNESNHTSIKRKYFNIMNDAFYGFNEHDYTDFAKA